MKLSEKILLLRRQQGLSQEEVAEKLGISRQSISRWELGTALPDASNLLQLSRLFSVSADFLLNDEWEDAAISPASLERKRKRRRLCALAVAALGAVGQFTIYLFSRAVEVMVPIVERQNGVTRFIWNSAITDHSYKYFVQEYDLEVLSAALWLLIALGLFVVVDWKALKEKWKQWKKKKEEEA